MEDEQGNENKRNFGGGFLCRFVKEQKQFDILFQENAGECTEKYTIGIPTDISVFS